MVPILAEPPLFEQEARGPVKAGTVRLNGRTRTASQIIMQNGAMVRRCVFLCLGLVDAVAQTVGTISDVYSWSTPTLSSPM